MNMKKLIPLIAIFFIVFGSANACNLIQEKTTEAISYCDNGDGTITASDKWLNCKNEQGSWYHCAVLIGGTWNYTIIDTGMYNATFNITDIEGAGFNFKTNNTYSNLVLKKVGEIEMKNAITGRYIEGGQLIYTFGEDSRFYYTPSITRLKEEFMLGSADVKTNKDFSVEWRIKDKSAGLEMYYDGELWDGSKKVEADTIQFKKDGILKFSFAKSFVMDSNDSFMWLKYEIKVLDNKQFITLTIPQSWLETAVFPIYIEPTTDINTSMGFIRADTFYDFGGGYSTINYGSNPYLDCRQQNVGFAYYRNSMINIDFSNINTNNVINATLNMYLYTKSITGTKPFNNYYANCTGWNETNLTYANRNALYCNFSNPNVLNTTAFFSETSDTMSIGWSVYNLTSIANKEITEDFAFTIVKTMYGIDSVVAGGTEVISWYSKESASNKPYFEITYDEPYAYRFYAYDKKNSNASLTNFFISASNSTFSSAVFGSGSNTSISVNTTELPTGTSTITFQKAGYNTTIFSQYINQSGGVVKGYLYPAGLIINAVKDETSSAGLTFNVTIYNSTTSMSFNSITSLEKNYTQIPNGDVTIIINNQSGGYEQRYFYLNINDYTTYNNTYYLLSNSDGLIRSFYVKDQSQNGISGALVTIKRQISGEWITVATKLTDSSGTSAFLLNPSTQYRVEATYQGLSSGVQTITPSETEYTLTIVTGQSYTYTNIFNTVSYTINPMYLSLPKTNSTYINFSVVCVSNDLEWYAVNLTDENYTQIFFQNNTNASGGKINANINTTDLSAVYGTFYIKRTDYALFTDTKNYLVSTYNAGNYSFFAFLTNLTEDTSMSNFSKSIISLFVIVGIMAGVVAMGISAMGAGVVGMTIITILSIMGWFYLPALIFMWVAVLGYVIVTRGGF
jgi:hypothetical protein